MVFKLGNEETSWVKNVESICTARYDVLLGEGKNSVKEKGPVSGGTYDDDSLRPIFNCWTK